MANGPFNLLVDNLLEFFSLEEVSDVCFLYYYAG